MKSNRTLLILAFIALPAVLSLIGASSKKTSELTKSARVQRGKYLVAFGGCADCHTPPKFGPHGPEPDSLRLFSGHPADLKLPSPPTNAGPWFAQTAGFTAWAGPWGVSYAANLTPDINTGIGIWTEAMFVKAMRTGRHMGGGRDILPPMPWPSLRGLGDEDLKAIFAYLRSLPPISNRVPDPRGPDGHVPFESTPVSCHLTPR